MDIKKHITYIYYFVVLFGVKENTSEDECRVHGLINIFSLIGFIYILTMAIVTWFSGYLMHTKLLFVLNLILLFNIYYHIVKTNYRFTYFLFCFFMTLLIAYLVGTGGVGRNGHLWTFMFPPLMTSMVGIKRGTVVIVFWLFIIAVITMVPIDSSLFIDYPDAFVPRFLMAFFGVSLISLFSEHSRYKTHNNLLITTSHLIDLTKELDIAARTDSLTKLSNRTDMYDKIDYEMDRSLRKEKPFSLIMTDIDFFKNINDSHGHDCGDQILFEVAEMLKQNLRKQDTISRWGGEEFLILLPETSLEGAVNIAEKLRSKVEWHSFFYRELKINFTISSGIAEWNLEDSADDLIKNADINLYTSKSDGRNRVTK